jgi:hypothetical protein
MSPDTLPPITLILIPAWARRPHQRSGWRYGPSGPVGVVLSTGLMLLPFGHT